MPVDLTGRDASRPETSTTRRAPISSRALLGQSRRILIEHDGEIYVLQVTKQNKLLLTK